MKFAPWVLLILTALLSVTYGQGVSDNGVTTEATGSSTAGSIISVTAIGDGKSRRVTTSGAFLMLTHILYSINFNSGSDSTSATLPTSTVMSVGGIGSTTTKKRRRLISCIRRFGDRGGFRVTHRTTISDSNSVNIQQQGI